MRHFNLLLKFMKGNLLLLGIAFAAMNLCALLSAAIPSLISVAIDGLIGSKDVRQPLWVLNLFNFLGGRELLARNLWITGLVIFLFTLCQGFFLYIKGKFAARVSENSGKKLRENVFDHLQHLPFDYHVKSQAGDLIQRCTSDVETIQHFVSSQFIEIGQCLLTLVYVLLMMLLLDPAYTLASTLLIPAIFFFTIRFFNNMKRIFRETDESEGRLSSTLQENLTGIRVVKAFGAQSFETDKFDEKNREYRDNVFKIVRLMSDFWSTSDFLCIVQYCTALLAGVYWIVNGTATLGTVVAFSTYASMLIWPVRQLGQTMAFMGQAFVSLSRVQEILDHPVEQNLHGKKKPDIKGEIEFKNVSFGYKSGAPVLKEVSFRIKRGQTVAFLGPTGSGKSSLVQLLVKLYDYDSGSIKIDGVELKEIDRKWMRKHVGIALQEPFLFTRSIRENVRLGRPDSCESDILTATSIAALHNTLQEFEQGYDTIVGERGVTLSGGQRQRLAIARTVVRNVPILIFDDSLSAVDMETDAEIRRTLRKRSRSTTTLIISHRITTLAEADLILVLENGAIVQQGRHEELIAQEGLYRRIWDIQNSLEGELTKAM